LKRFTYLGFVLFVLFSCKKDKLNGDKSVLIGKWVWNFTHVEHCSNSLFDIVKTPLTESNEFQIEFFEKGKVMLLKNNHKEECNRIVFSEFYFYSPSNSYYFEINMDNKENKNLSGLCYPGPPDTLMIFEFPFPLDGSNYCFSRNYFIREN